LFEALMKTQPVVMTAGPAVGALLEKAAPANPEIGEAGAEPVTDPNRGD
jgi:hypothetical protein